MDNILNKIVSTILTIATVIILISVVLLCIDKNKNYSNTIYASEISTIYYEVNSMTYEGKSEYECEVPIKDFNIKSGKIYNMECVTYLVTEEVNTEGKLVLVSKQPVARKKFSFKTKAKNDKVIILWCLDPSKLEGFQYYTDEYFMADE